MTDPTIPDVVIPSHVAAELRVRANVLRRVLTEFIDRTAPTESELAGMLRMASEHAAAIADVIGRRGDEKRRAIDPNPTQT